MNETEKVMINTSLAFINSTINLNFGMLHPVQLGSSSKRREPWHLHCQQEIAAQVEGLCSGTLSRPQSCSSPEIQAQNSTPKCKHEIKIYLVTASNGSIHQSVQTQGWVCIKLLLVPISICRCLK